MATIDPSIISGLRPIQLDDPVNKLAQVMQIQGMQRQAQAQDFEMGQRRQAIERQNRLSQLLGGFEQGVTPEQQAAQLTRGGFLSEAQTVTKTAAENAKSQREAEKAQREAEKAQLETTLQKINIGGQILSSVRDPASYQRASQLAAQAGFGAWPEQYEPAWVQQQIQQGMSLKDQAEQAWRARQDATTRRGQDLTAQTAANRLALDQQNAGEKPLTDAQAKAALFGTRMQEANSIFDTLEKQGTTVSVPGSRAPLGIGAVINALSPADQQQLDQAKRDFINAVLRRESGAVISDSEFANAEKQYFPQIGDSSAVVAQKKRNREVAQRGVMVEVPKNRRESINQEITGGQPVVSPASGNSRQKISMPNGFIFIGVEGK